MNANKQITYTIHKLAFLLNKMTDHILEEGFEISFSQFRILIAINRNGGVCQKQIATFWEVTEAAVSRHIENLLVKKLIESEQNKENRRENILNLTETGKEQLKKAYKKIDDEYEVLYHTLGQKERKIFVQSLDKLLNALCSTKGTFDCTPTKS